MLRIDRLLSISAGKVAEIKAEKAEVTSNKGNVISKNGTEEDPAVIIERPGVSHSTSFFLENNVGEELIDE